LQEEKIINKSTIGKQIAEKSSDRSDNDIDPREVTKLSEQEHLESLHWCAMHAMKKVPCVPECDQDYCSKREAFTGDFYVEVLERKEPIFDASGMMVKRLHQIPKKACPTPFFDQTLWKYHEKSGEFEDLWVIPDIDTCLFVHKNKHNIPIEFQVAIPDIEKFLNGDLHRICQKLNGEEIKKGSILYI
jgi:hypothetical protein